MPKDETDEPKVLLGTRIPVSLRDRIVRVATDQRRSITVQTEMIIEEGLKPWETARDRKRSAR